MKLKITVASLFAPLCLVTSPQAAASSSFKQLQAGQSCLNCQTIQVIKTEWQKFSSDKGKFSVLMPGKPTEETQTDKSSDVPTEDHTFTVGTEEHAFIVGYSEFGVDITQVKPDELLDAACTGLSQGGDKLLSKRTISLNGHPGREVEYKSNDGLIGKGRIYLVGRRLYQLYAVNPQVGDAKKFFDSFELKP